MTGIDVAVREQGCRRADWILSSPSVQYVGEVRCCNSYGFCLFFTLSISQYPQSQWCSAKTVPSAVGFSQWWSTGDL